MKNRETGEFELVVGNAQIIGGFFIMALLLAVFFALGFIVARAKYQQEPATVTAASTPSSQPEAPAPSATPSPTPSASGAAPPPETKSEPAAAGAPPADTAVAAAPAKSEPAPEPAEAPQGTYWQVTSTSDPAAARAMLQSMKDLGLPASLSPGPNNFTRVLVGPYTDNATLAKVKTQLENAGLHPLKHTQ